MALSSFADTREAADFKICHDRVQLHTAKRIQFIDVSELVCERVRRAGIYHGIVNVQTQHTTTGIVLNENEPQLLQDFEERLEAWAPRELTYKHNDMHARRFQRIAPDEQPNGDAYDARSSPNFPVKSPYGSPGSVKLLVPPTCFWGGTRFEVPRFS